MNANLETAFVDRNTALQDALEKRWAYAACSRFGELLEARRLFPIENVVIADNLTNDLRILIERDFAALTHQVATELKHARSMVTSGYGLIYEEVIAVLTILSEVTFVIETLRYFRKWEGRGTIEELRVSRKELEGFLSAQRRAVRGLPNLSHTIVLHIPTHWWWRVFA